MAWKTSSFASGTLGAQTGIEGNTIILNASTYTGRLLILRRGNSTTEEYFLLVSHLGSNEYLLDKNWKVTPASGDAFDIGYIPADGSADYSPVSNTSDWYTQSSKINLTSTGFHGYPPPVQTDTVDIQKDSTTDGPYEIQSGCVLLLIGASFYTRNGGGTTDGYIVIEVKAGGDLIMDNADYRSVNDTKIEGQGATSVLRFLNGSKVTYGLYNFLAEGLLEIKDSAFFGTANANDDITLGTGSVLDVDGCTLVDHAGWNVPANMTADPVVRRVVSNNPFNGVEIVIGSGSEFEWVDSLITFTLASVNAGTSATTKVREAVSITGVVTEPDGTAIENFRLWAHEGLTNDDLPSRNEVSTDSNGEYTSDLLFGEIVGGTPEVLTSYGTYAWKGYKYGVQSYVTAANETDGIPGERGILLPIGRPDDANVDAATAALALTGGTGITYTEEATNPHSLIKYTGGAGTITGTITASPSGASGTFEHQLDGDSVAGTALLRARNGTAFANGDTLSNGAGWTANYTASSEQRFDWRIDCNNKTLQAAYDHERAQTDKTHATIPTVYKDVIIWGGREHADMLQAVGGNTYKTERNVTNSAGVIAYNYAAGSVSYFTDNAGVQYVPPVNYSVTWDGMFDNSEVRVYAAGTSTELAGIENATAGTPDNRNFSASLAALTLVDYTIVSEQYEIIRVEGFEWPSANTTIAVQQRFDRNYEPSP